MCGPKARVVIAIAAGALLLFLGIVSLTVAPSFIDRAYLNQDFLGYEVVNGTEKLNAMTQQWQAPPYDQKLQIYLFDVANPMDVMKGAKPRVREVGPFTFVEKQSKTFDFVANDTRVIYKNKHEYYFNSSLSCPNCSLDRKITIPNVIFQKLVDFAEMGMLYKFAVQAVLTAVGRETPFITVTVGEALFDGYADPLIDAICNKPILRAVCATAKIPERIGFFYKQNNTDDGAYEIDTGRTGAWNIGKVCSWNNQSSMPNTTWDSPYARMVNGTDGQLFPPLLQKTDSFHIFAAMACRTIWMDFVEVSSYRDVPSYRYGIPSSLFDPSHGRNSDFCNKDTPQIFNSSVQKPGCLPKGFLDVGRCQEGAPRVYLSQAHFLDAADDVISMIEGVAKGSEKNDTTFVDLEPTSGVPIRARRAMQLNLGMLKGNLDMLANTSNMIVPVLWMNETVLFDDGTRNQLHDQLLYAKHVFFDAGVILVVGGAVVWIALAAVVLIFTVSKQSSGEEEEPIIPAEEQHEEEEP